jgi:hypothetical protein
LVVAFAAEAISAGDAHHAARMVDTRLEDGGVLVWDDDGPVSVVALSPPVAGVPANPTSNKIYAEVGYHRFGAWEEYRFEPPPSRTNALAGNEEGAHLAP